MTKGTSPYRLPVTHAAVSARTGLDAVEAALLDAVDLLGADDTGEPVACSRVLQVVAHRAEAVTHQVAVAAHQMTDAAHHLGDAVVDVLLSPLAPELADFHVEITEDDIL